MTALERWIRLKESLDRNLERFAPHLAARIDLRHPERWERWGPPWNGQVHRQAMIREIVTSYRPDAFIETGTYRGMTTDFMRREFNLEVYSAELNDRYFAFCQRRFADDLQVHLLHGDSRRLLRQLASASQLRRLRPLFYLDAHWYDDLPLREELAIVCEGWHEWVVVIDDFRVPGDDGYGHDDYGPGSELELGYLKGALTSDYATFWPSAPSALETGSRRGCVVLASRPEPAGLLAGLPSLRCHDTS